MASGVFEEHFRKNGNITFPGAPSAIMAVLAREEPESLQRAATASYCKDMILHRLTGIRATDVSEASEPFMDHGTRNYDPKLLELFGLEAYEHLLAPIDPAPGHIRTLNAEGAELTGLPEETLVHNGPFDLPATATGAGIANLGDGVVILGTTLACEVLTDSIDTSGEPGGADALCPRAGSVAQGDACHGRHRLNGSDSLLTGLFARVSRRFPFREPAGGPWSNRTPVLLFLWGACTICRAECPRSVFGNEPEHHSRRSRACGLRGRRLCGEALFRGGGIARRGHSLWRRSRIPRMATGAGRCAAEAADNKRAGQRWAHEERRWQPWALRTSSSITTNGLSRKSTWSRLRS